MTSGATGMFESAPRNISLWYSEVPTVRIGATTVSLNQQQEPGIGDCAYTEYAN